MNTATSDEPFTQHQICRYKHFFLSPQFDLSPKCWQDVIKIHPEYCLAVMGALLDSVAEVSPQGFTSKNISSRFVDLIWAIISTIELAILLEVTHVSQVVSTRGAVKAVEVNVFLLYFGEFSFELGPTDVTRAGVIGQFFFGWGFVFEDCLSASPLTTENRWSFPCLQFPERF